jgi:hypothetical protein
MSPGTVSLELTKGWTALRTLRMARNGNLGLSMVDLAWTAATGLPEPHLLSLMPVLHYLSNKLVHFVLDYHPDWIADLRLPPSDGSHRHLRTEGFHAVLNRLDTIPDVDAPLQLFSAVDIGHKDWRGVQTVHAIPFPTTKTRMVYGTTDVYACICEYMHVYVSICLYMHVYACIYIYIYVLTRISMYMYVYVCICLDGVLFS